MTTPLFMKRSLRGAVIFLARLVSFRRPRPRVGALAADCRRELPGTQRGFHSLSRRDAAEESGISKRGGAVFCRTAAWRGPAGHLEGDRRDATLQLTFTRNLAALSDGVTFTVESIDMLLNDWSAAGVSAPRVLSDNGVTRQLKVTLPEATMMKDGVHPDANGNAVITGTLLPKLKP